jgi:hypothetical protein
MHLVAHLSLYLAANWQADVFHCQTALADKPASECQRALKSKKSQARGDERGTKQCLVIDSHIRLESEDWHASLQQDSFSLPPAASIQHTNTRYCIEKQFSTSSVASITGGKQGEREAG